MNKGRHKNNVRTNRWSWNSIGRYWKNGRRFKFVTEDIDKVNSGNEKMCASRGKLGTDLLQQSNLFRNFRRMN